MEAAGDGGDCGRKRSGNPSWGSPEGLGHMAGAAGGGCWGPPLWAIAHACGMSGRMQAFPAGLCVAFAARGRGGASTQPGVERQRTVPASRNKQSGPAPPAAGRTAALLWHPSTRRRLRACWRIAWTHMPRWLACLLSAATGRSRCAGGLCADWQACVGICR